MNWHVEDGITLGTFGSLETHSRVKAAFSTRKGGVSAAPFDQLNLGRNTQDNPENVVENRRRFFQTIGVRESELALQQQVHEDTIRYVTEPGTCLQTDAQFTDQPGIYLLVTVADCVPILFHWPRKNVVGVIHAGWKGTAKNITRQTMEKMEAQFGGDLGDVVAVLGPSIGPDHYEVSEEVAGQFDERVLIRGRGPRPYLDLWKANGLQLEAAGVGNIEYSNLCTFARSDLFFSHRKSGGKTGRMLGVIGLTRSLRE